MTESQKLTLNKSYKDKLFIQDCIFIILLLAGVIFAIWKCRYGFGGNDEAFYLATPHRLTLGDALIRDEWHLSQLSSVLLYPFVWLYTLLTGGTTGIMLTVRFLYILLHCAVSILIYAKFRKYGFASVVASVLFFVYTPYDIMALSYNTMGLDLVVVAGVLLSTANYDKKLSLIFSGLAFAGAVLCNPYLIIAYFLFAICMVVNVILKKLSKTKNFFAGDYFSCKTFLWFTVGAAILAAVFLIFLLSRTSISDFQTNLPYMMTDPEHPQIPIATKLEMYFRGIWNASSLFFVSIIAYGVILLGMIIDRKRRNHRVLYLVLTCCVVIFAYISFCSNLVDYNYNSIMFPVIYLGITSYILTKNKNRSLLAGLFSLGIIYSFAMCFSSNQYFYVISMAFSSTNIASFVFAGILLREMKEEKELDDPKKIPMLSWNSLENTQLSIKVTPKKLAAGISLILVCIVMLTQTCLQSITKANHVFWEAPIPNLTSKLIGGPADGILTTAANAVTYQSILADINASYSDKQRENLLILSEKTWTYLAAEDMNYATFSAWISGENETSVARLQQYYSVNPAKKPKYIYIPKASSWDLSNIITQAAAKGYNVSETNASYQLVKN